MKYRMYWVLGVLAILIIGVTVFSVLKNRAEIERLKRELEIALHGHHHADGDPAHSDGTEDNPSNDVRPEKKINLGNVLKTIKETKPNTETPKPKPKKPLFTGALTFHAELLKTNPVKALRLQQEERGHWSAEWIPPFPTDDTEAQEYARARYLQLYYIQNYGFEKLGTPEYEKETKVYREARETCRHMRDTIVSYPYGARKSDLMKLMWPGQETPISVWGDGTVDPTPSEYFGDPEMRAFLKDHGAWDY